MEPLLRRFRSLEHIYDDLRGQLETATRDAEQARAELSLARTSDYHDSLGLNNTLARCSAALEAAVSGSSQAAVNLRAKEGQGLAYTRRLAQIIMATDYLHQRCTQAVLVPGDQRSALQHMAKDTPAGQLAQAQADAQAQEIGRAHV